MALALKLPGPTKGHKPDFSGVPGEIVQVDSLSLAFWTRRTGRGSPYDALLEKLLDAPKGSAIKFGDPRARASVLVRARKKGLKLSFAEWQGALYVRIDGWVKEQPEAAKGGRREAIAAALKSGPASGIKLAQCLRAAGDANIDANLCESILLQMMRTGEVLQQDGGSWVLNPRAKK